VPPLKYEFHKALHGEASARIAVKPQKVQLLQALSEEDKVTFCEDWNTKTLVEH
jgi:hypothetical protein